MYKNLVTRRTLLGAAVASGCGPVWAAAAALRPTRVAWVYVSPVTDAGWTHQHELARQEVARTLGAAVHTTAVASVPEGPDAERVLRDLARQGNQMIFTTSFGYMEPVLRVAREFPQVRFEALTGLRRAPNVATANVRYYEGRYLAGIAAARMSRTGLAGYVAGFPIPEVLQGINAFALGMRSVHPYARVQVVWLNGWFDPAREREAATTLMNQGADVLAFHTGSDAVAVAAQQRGRLVVAYHSDMRRVAPDAQIVAVTHWWGRYEVARVRALRGGIWRSQDSSLGVHEGAVRVGDFGRRVPVSVQQEVLRRQAELAAGRLQPFAGPLVSSTGRRVLAAGQRLTEPQVQQMNWLVQGVQAPPWGR